MRIYASRRPVVVVVSLALWAAGCTAPSDGASAVPGEPAVTVAPPASPAASGGGKYGDETKPPDDPYVDDYATPAP